MDANRRATTILPRAAVACCLRNDDPPLLGRIQIDVVSVSASLSDDAQIGKLLH
jgi:hypothetical protein